MEGYKFGGSSQKDEESFQNCLDVIAQAERPCLVVPSTIGGITDLLEQGAQAQAESGIFPNSTLRQIEEKFVAVHGKGHSMIEEAWRDLKARIKRGKEKDLNNIVERDAQQAALVSWGEPVQATLFAEALTARGIKTRYVSSEGRMILQGNPLNGDFTSQSRENFRLILQDGFKGVTVLDGFVGEDSTGAKMVLGRGASDTSWAFYCRVAGAKLGYNCTDVPGILPANPNDLPSELRNDVFQRTIPSMNFEQVQELSGRGAKVLHARAVDYMKGARGESPIPFFVCRSSNFSGKRTYVSDFEAPETTVLAITGRTQAYTTVTLNTGSMERARGYFSKFADAFREVDVDLTPSGNIQLSVSFHDTSANLEMIAQELSPLGEVLFEIPDLNGDAEKWKRSLSPYAEVKITPSFSPLAMVGSNLGKKPQILGDFMDALGKANVPVAQITKANDNSMWVLVPSRQYKDACAAVYGELILK